MHERYRLATWAIVTNVVSTALGMLAFVITVPLTLTYLGDERFGVWMTIASLAGMLSLLDFGVGNALINHVATAKAADNPLQLRRVITHGLLLLSAIGLAVGLILVPSIHWLPLDRLIRVTNSLAAEEAKQTLAVFAVLFSASIPLNGLHKAFQGLQRSWQAHLVKGLASVLSIGLVIALTQKQAGPPSLLLATYGVQVFMLFPLLVILLRENLIGKSGKTGREGQQVTIRGFLRLGRLFLILQVGVMIGWGSDALIISSVLGAAEVTKLAIVQRLFQVVTVPLAIVNGPLWGAYAEAHGRHDHAFVSRTLRLSFFGTALIATLASGALLLASQWIFKTWIGETSVVPTMLVIACALWVILEATGNAFAMFLNGIGKVRVQVISTLLFCVIALPLKFALVANYGVAGIVFATIVAYLITPVGLYALLFRKEVLGAESRPQAPG
jgi:O-antigen/teichoic acid export membrane protein